MPESDYLVTIPLSTTTPNVGYSIFSIVISLHMIPFIVHCIRHLYSIIPPEKSGFFRGYIPAYHQHTRVDYYRPVFPP